MNKLLVTDKTWTLFLDRDGVINRHLPDDYVKTWAEFEFISGALEALKGLSFLFNQIVIVTNQQGIGKELMTLDDLHSIHLTMKQEIEQAGGRIDAIYFAEKLKEHDAGFRKPALGMAHQAKFDFPEIDFEKAIMVGDSLTDMQFGRAAGMKTVFVGNGQKLKSEDWQFIDFYADSLHHFYTLLNREP